jgi:hypothetical protein
MGHPADLCTLHRGKATRDDQEKADPSTSLATFSRARFARDDKQEMAG